MDGAARILILLENETYPLDRRVSQIAVTLADAGYDVTVAAPRPDLAAAEEEVDGVRVLRFAAPPQGTSATAFLREYAVSLRALRSIARRVERERPPDVVISANPPDFLFLAARAAARRGARLIFDHHDLAPELFEEKFGRRGAFHRALLMAERWSFRKADVVLSTNNSYADVARARGDVPTDRIFVVRNAPDPDRISQVPPEPQLRRGREHLIAWVGRMSVQEGLETAVGAAEELRRRGRSDVSFALVGSGSALDGLVDDVHRRGLDDIVAFPGQVEHATVSRYLSTASICLNVDPHGPLNDRSTMIKVLEYMALGRPIVQTPLDEMVRLCGDATSYARPDDPIDFADRIEELLDDPAKAADLGDRARRRIVEKGLTWPDQVPRLLTAVQTALAASRN
jgi:glycosyltransferase involved in cell wall biosynthesis